MLKITQNSETLLKNLANIDIQVVSYFSDTENLLLHQTDLKAKNIKKIRLTQSKYFLLKW